MARKMTTRRRRKSRRPSELNEFTEFNDLKCFQTFRVLSRTVVFENDPLGALLDNEPDEIIQVQQTQPLTEEQLEKARIQQAMFSDQPVLFKGHRSATFDDASNLNKGIHRSETMPVQSITSSIANIGSSLKFGFR